MKNLDHTKMANLTAGVSNWDCLTSVPRALLFSSSPATMGQASLAIADVVWCWNN